jgi:meiotically up-regulated gene 157 (Mug157) protein
MRAGLGGSSRIMRPAQECPGRRQNLILERYHAVMPTRRNLLLSALAGGGLLAGALRSRAAPKVVRAPRRPPPGERRIMIPAVEAELRRVKKLIADPEISWLFENCYPNTLDTTVTLGARDGKPDTFVVTGDIPAQWLRDSSAQVWPYLRLAAGDPVLRRLFRGLIHRHARCILIDPYANAFLSDPDARTPLPWAEHDETLMKPGVAERKWEVDSLCHPIRLAYGYWRATGDTQPFDAEWLAAMRLVLHTFREQQRLDDAGPYRFKRQTDTPNDTVPLDGYGAPTRKVGLIHSMFRPSDDACVYPFLIPANLLAAACLRRLTAIVDATDRNAAFMTDCQSLAQQIEQCVASHGRMTMSGGSVVLAYECDAYGNQLFMDDANIPGLLSLPYLEACNSDDPLYERTRARVLSADNPYFFKGIAAEGIGGPHIGLRAIWPLGIMVRALTSEDDAEILTCLRWLSRTHAETGFMHESFDQDDASRFTRGWFAWANSLFGELILDIGRRKPALLRVEL